MTSVLDAAIARELRHVGGVLDRRTAADARRLLDDLLIGADGCWRETLAAYEEVNNFLDKFEAERPTLLRDLEQQLRAQMTGRDGPTGAAPRSEAAPTSSR
jgi:hypothetical protein